MCLPVGGLVQQLVKAVISRYALGNGTVNIATRESINVRNVPTANSSRLDIMTFIGILKGKTQMDVTL